MSASSSNRPTGKRSRHLDQPIWRRAHADFRRWIRLAKEALSSTAGGVDLQYPGSADHEPLWLTKDEVDEVLLSALAETITVLDRTIAAAGLLGAHPRCRPSPRPAGGSSKIRLAERLIVNHFGPSARLEDDRKQVVALGAAGAPRTVINSSSDRRSPLHRRREVPPQPLPGGAALLGLPPPAPPGTVEARPRSSHRRRGFQLHPRARVPGHRHRRGCRTCRRCLPRVADQADARGRSRRIGCIGLPRPRRRRSRGRRRHQPWPAGDQSSPTSPYVTMVYVVHAGDSLAGIASTFGTTLEGILALNPQVLAYGTRSRSGTN